MSIFALNINLSQKEKSILCFCLFSCWLLSVPFEGQVLYKLMENSRASGIPFNKINVFAHFIGLFSSGFFIKKQNAAKMTMITSTVVCIAGSLVFYLPFTTLWYFVIFFVSLFSGFYVASWGFYLKNYFPTGERFKTIAEVLIYSNILMIFINITAVNVSAFIALTISMIALFGSLLIALRLEACPDVRLSNAGFVPLSGEISSIRKPMIFLCLFILIITINSGLMYQVVNPAFSQLPMLTSYYWAIPYIVALLILKNKSNKVNQAYTLYSAMTMIGLSFILFMVLNRSALSYLIINSLMMGAFGICDLFWWSILGSFFDYTGNPAKILGIGLSMNVLGIFIGEFVGSIIASVGGGQQEASIAALIIIFVIIILLPILNNHLSRLLKNHVFLVNFTNMKENERDRAIIELQDIKQLTDREIEVVELLLQGYTYKAVAEKLVISENTMKYHVKNIYQKLNINSKMELIKIFAENERKNANLR